MMPHSSAVPFEWSHLVCTCHDPKQGEWAPLGSGKGHICVDCKKQFRYVLRTCKDCRTIFLVTEFLSNRECFQYSRCLTCISLIQTPCEHTRCRELLSARPDLQVLHTYEKQTVADFDDVLGDLVESTLVDFDF